MDFSDIRTTLDYVMAVLGEKIEATCSGELLNSYTFQYPLFPPNHLPQKPHPTPARNCTTFAPKPVENVGWCL